MKTICLLGMLFLVGCSVDAIKPCPSEVDGAVLNKMVSEFNLTTYTATADDITANETRLKCVKEWAEAIDDSCTRNAYLKWIEFYEDDYKKLRRDLGKKPETPFLDEYDERQRSIRDYERKNPIPAPPSCERGVVERVK